VVVVDGADRLREGAKVEVVTRDAPASATPEAARKGKRGIRRAPRFFALERDRIIGD
jgi:hypothetical protein